MKVSEEEFQTNVNKFWIYELSLMFRKANLDLYNHYNQKNKFIQLKTPNFEIITNNQYWGTWASKNRILGISEKLIRHFPYEAVEHVMRHEVAHMIVDEIWGVGNAVSPHGETFASACAILGIEPTSSDSSSYLMKFGKTNEKVVDKVKKLMALGESPNKNEAERALKKAYELMTKHNIKNIHDENSSQFNYRPIGIKCGKRTPSFMYDIGRIVDDFYYVKYIRSHHYDGRTGGTYKHFEIFGKPENLDLAEYVWHFLYNQGQILWEDFAIEKIKEGYKKKGDSLIDPDHDYWNRGDNYSKSSFLQGVYAGYSSKLRKEQRENETHLDLENNSELNELIDISKSKLDKAYNKRYRVKRSSRSGSSANGHGDGYAKGKSMNIRSGVSSSGGTKYLN